MRCFANSRTNLFFAISRTPNCEKIHRFSPWYHTELCLQHICSLVMQSPHNVSIWSWFSLFLSAICHSLVSYSNNEALKLPWRNKCFRYSGHFCKCPLLVINRRSSVRSRVTNVWRWGLFFRGIQLWDQNS